MFWIGHSEFVNISNSVLLHVARLENITIPDYQVNYKLLFNDLANLLDQWSPDQYVRAGKRAPADMPRPAPGVVYLPRARKMQGADL